MKRNIKILITAAMVCLTPLLIFAQPHPGDPRPGGTPVGGNPPAGAPIGNGTFILLTLAMAYAGRKVYVMRTEEEVA